MGSGTSLVEFEGSRRAAKKKNYDHRFKNVVFLPFGRKLLSKILSNNNTMNNENS